MHKLMIVDDEPLAIKAISYIINNNLDDIEIIARIRNGSKAVKVAREKKPDIILMDIKLEGLNGLEAINEITKFNPESKIVIISAYDNFNYAQKAIKLGVLDYLLKPVNKSDILNILNKVRSKINQGKHRGNLTYDNTKKPKPAITEAKKYIDNNFNKDIGLEDISEHVAISPNYLSRLFKENYNITIIDYLTEVRIKAAIDLLNNTNLHIKEISKKVGYNDSNYFSKVFKKIIDKTPTDFRKNQ